MTLNKALEEINDIVENDALSTKVGQQAIENILTRFARSIVEQSVPEERNLTYLPGEGMYTISFEGVEYPLAVPGKEWNSCRSQTLSNADNLLK